MTSPYVGEQSWIGKLWCHNFARVIADQILEGLSGSHIVLKVVPDWVAVFVVTILSVFDTNPNLFGMLVQHRMRGQVVASLLQFIKKINYQIYQKNKFEFKKWL
jgi:hypothetical protein